VQAVRAAACSGRYVAVQSSTLAFLTLLVADRPLWVLLACSVSLRCVQAVAVELARARLSSCCALVALATLSHSVAVLALVADAVCVQLRQLFKQSTSTLLSISTATHIHAQLRPL
jgi:hypothetical protein